jgi:uncharacterized protein
MSAYLCDINFLLSLVTDRHQGFLIANDWLQSQSGRFLGLCRLTQLGLMRLLTNKSVMGEDTCNQSEAWSVWDRLLSDCRFSFWREPTNMDKVFRRMTGHSQPSTKLWNDAYLAAFAVQSDRGLVTFDKGFSQFPGLDVVLLNQA